MQHEIIKISIIMQRFSKAIAAIMLMTAMCFVAGCSKPEAPNNGGNNDGENTSDNDVRVTTYTPQNITQTTVRCGGDVVVTQGIVISELGLCWSTRQNPTVEDAHIYTSNCSGPLVWTLTGLEQGTCYHVRVYALRGLEYYYGEDKSFTTEGNSGNGSGGWENHTWVDLGLPSGTLWAICNVGANAPEGYGDYFAWGETQTKDNYDWSNYQYCIGHGGYNTLTKYIDKAEDGYNGVIDNLITLMSSDDAATANWGNDWHTPTKEQWIELFNNTTKSETNQNGVKGTLFTSSNGQSIFMPAAGYRRNSSLYDASSLGNYWSSSLSTFSSSCASYFGFIGDSQVTDANIAMRINGLSVRPVRSN